MTSRRWLLTAMIVTVSLVAAVLMLDEQREFEESVQNLKDEQVALATAVAADLETRLHRLEQEGGPRIDEHSVAPLIPRLFGGALKLHEDAARVLLVAPPGSEHLLTTRGERIHSELLRTAIRSGVSGLVIPREEAPRFGLPPRIAIAGIETITSASGSWAVAVLVSGARLRNRERYAQLRFVLSLGLVTAVVSAFGGLALRQERRKLEVARALEISALAREREKLLANADKMATLAALSSGIAHEVATPLGTIMARVEQLLLSHADDPASTSDLQEVMEQVERIQTIIRGVLGLARGELPPLVRAKAADVVSGAVALASHRFEQAGVQIAVELEPDLPEITCDPPMLEQALTNLLLNACDASPRGALVQLSARSDSSCVCFIVEDEGEGMDLATTERALQPFFTTKPRGRGTGLGLAITREVLGHHGGKLRLEGRADARGTRAVMELPPA